MKLTGAFLLIFPALVAFESAKTLPFFQVDNIIYLSQNGTPGQVNMTDFDSQLRVVKAVVSDSGAYSDCLLTMRSERNIDYGPYLQRYAQDRGNFYVHAANWLLERADNDATVKKYVGDSLCYPLQMKPGDTLPDAWAKEITVEALYSREERMRFFDRHVVKCDTVSVPFGYTIAYLIEMNVSVVIESVSKYNGKLHRQEDLVVREWFSPEIGIVKTENSDKFRGVAGMHMVRYK